MMRPPISMGFTAWAPTGSATATSATALSNSGMIEVSAAAQHFGFGELDIPASNAGGMTLALDLNGDQLRAVEQLAAEGIIGETPDEVVQFLIVRALDDCWRSGAFRPDPAIR